MNKNKIIIILVGFLDVLWIWIVIPTLAELGKYYNVSSHLMAYWVTTYALCTFLATPFLWQVSDIIGRKKILLICVIWTFLSSLLIGLTQSYLFFILWRIINWITWGNISILQAIIGDISKDKEDRKANMWILGSLFGAGFVIGPLIWALLLRFGVNVPYLFMAGFALLEVIVLWIFLEETNKHMVSKKIKFNTFGQISKYLKKPWLNLFLISYFIITVALSLYQWVFSLVMYEDYVISWEQAGYIMSGVWVILVINQAFLLRKFWLKRFNLNKLIYIINIWFFIVFILLTLSKTVLLFILCLLCVAPLQWLLNPIYQWEMSEHATLHEKWELMWVISSVQAIAMFVWPLFWWILLASKMPIFWFSAIIIFFSIILVPKMIKSVK